MTSKEKKDDAELTSLFDSVVQQVEEANKTEKYVRPTWDEYFMTMMEAISLRSTCDRGRSGCVIVKGHQVLATGYVGSAAGDDHCDDVGHLFQKRLNPDGSTSQHCVRTVHAEQNAICQAAKNGTALAGGTLYCRMTPCPVCSRMIVNCGIKRVVCQRRYHDSKVSVDLFEKCGITLEHMFDEVQQYSNQK